MTRSRTFLLPVANTWYNLWSLIKADASFTEPTFTTAPYFPSVVNQLNYQSQGAITNANNGGSLINVSFDGVNKSGDDLSSASFDVMRGVIDLKSIWFRSSIGGAGINVTAITNH
jgi:hypothetical protein